MGGLPVDFKLILPVLTGYVKGSDRGETQVFFWIRFTQTIDISFLREDCLGVVGRRSSGRRNLKHRTKTT